MILTLSAELVN